MEWIILLGGMLLAYLLGSIPTSVLVGKTFYHIDIRNEGSGNAGATNTIRVLGVKAGIPVIIVDVVKGYVAVFLIHFFAPSVWAASQLTYAQIIAGFVAVLGHVYPVFAGFRGGKGCHIAWDGYRRLPICNLDSCCHFYCCVIVLRLCFPWFHTGGFVVSDY